MLRATTAGGAGGKCPVRSHSNPWTYTRGHIRPSLRWADLRDGDRSGLLLQVLDRRTWDRQAAKVYSGPSGQHQNANQRHDRRR